MIRIYDFARCHCEDACVFAISPTMREDYILHYPEMKNKSEIKKTLKRI